MLRRAKHIAIAVIAMAAMAAPVSAATVIDFSNEPAISGGSIYLEGTEIIGVNIPIGNASITGSPMHSGTSWRVYGTATGDPAGLYGDLDFNTGTNEITLSGCIPGLVGSLNTSGQCTTTEVLFSGTITTFGTLVDNRIAYVAGFDTKNAQLLLSLGLDPNTPFVLTGTFQTIRPFGQGEENGEPSVSTDIVQTAVPEPATMMLLGTGLLAAFRARRRVA